MLAIAGKTKITAAALLPQLSLYSVASLIALSVDFAVYIGLCTLAVNPSVAGVAGYAVGMTVHYLLSTSFVFAVARRFVGFAASGMLGLGLTGFVIATLTQSPAVSPVAAKIAAVIVSFLAVFLVRRWIVFASPPIEKNSSGELVY